MAYSRRTFLAEAVAGAGLSALGMPAVGNGQSPPQEVVPTPRAKALMELFGLRYPIFQAPAASGTVLGTRFMATEESEAHPDYKRALVRAHADDTALSVCFQDGWPGATHRTLRNGTLVR